MGDKNEQERQKNSRERVMRVQFNAVLKDVTRKGTKIQTDEYLTEGKFPIIDQGNNDIAGYRDDETGLFTDVPAIVFGDHTRIVKYITEPFFLGADGVKVLVPIDRTMNCKYLYYQLLSAKIPDTGYNRHFKWVKELEFQLPSRNEQDDVVKRLDKLCVVISARQQQLAKLDELVKARFIEIFGKYENGTTTVFMEDVSEMITVGIANSATHAYAENGVIMFRNQNIKEGFLDDSDLIYITEEFASKYKTKQLKENDLLITRTGYPGIACIVPKKYEGTQTFTTLIVRLKNSGRVMACYACNYINSYYGKRYVESMKAGVAQQNFGAKALDKMPIFIPPMDEQIAFENFVERSYRTKLILLKGLEQMETLKKALMQQYFG